MDAHGVITCQELVDLVTDYLEAALPPEKNALFKEHLDACRACRTFLEQMRRTIQLTGALKAEHISPQVERELVDIFRDWKKQRNK